MGVGLPSVTPSTIDLWPVELGAHRHASTPAVICCAVTLALNTARLIAV